MLILYNSFFFITFLIILGEKQKTAVSNDCLLCLKTNRNRLVRRIEKLCKRIDKIN